MNERQAANVIQELRYKEWLVFILSFSEYFLN
jgi:hypothetical protein